MVDPEDDDEPHGNGKVTAATRLSNECKLVVVVVILVQCSVKVYKTMERRKVCRVDTPITRSTRTDEAAPAAAAVADRLVRFRAPRRR